MQAHVAMLSSLGAFDCKWGDGRLTLTAPSKTAAVSAVAPLLPPFAFAFVVGNRISQTDYARSGLRCSGKGEAKRRAMRGDRLG